MTTIANKSKTLSGITRASGIMTVIGVGAVVTAGTADAGGKHHHKRHWHGGHGIHFDFYPRHRYYDRAYYNGGSRYCHNHRYKRRGMRNHKRIRCHFHRRWRDDSIRYVR